MSITEEGRSAVPLDLSIDPKNMDLLTNEGFCNAMYFACSLAPGAGHVSAPVCSTWVFMWFVGIGMKVVMDHQYRKIWFIIELMLEAFIRATSNNMHTKLYTCLVMSNPWVTLCHHHLSSWGAVGVPWDPRPLHWGERTPRPCVTAMSSQRVRCCWCCSAAPKLAGGVLSNQDHQLCTYILFFRMFWNE